VNILLLQLKRIGDLILTMPAIVALRENFPDARVTLVVSNECASRRGALTNYPGGGFEEGKRFCYYFNPLKNSMRSLSQQ